MFDGTWDSGVKSSISWRNYGCQPRNSQWQWQSGHPSLFVLQKLYPTLFSRTEFDSLFRDVCEYAKHTRNSCPLSDDKSNTPFMIIHYDVGSLLKPILCLESMVCYLYWLSHWNVLGVSIEGQKWRLLLLSVIHKMTWTQYEANIKIWQWHIIHGQKIGVYQKFNG